MAELNLDKTMTSLLMAAVIIAAMILTGCATAAPPPTAPSIPSKAEALPAAEPPVQQSRATAEAPSEQLRQTVEPNIQERTISDTGLSVTDPGCAGDRYDREEWAPSSKAWSDARRAAIADGGLVGQWTGKSITSASEADIDHHVPVAHAHGAGGCHWSEAKRNAYYTDLSNLNVTTPAMNRSKGADAPGHWKRQDEFIDTAGERCRYATQWIAVKEEHGLAYVTRAEVEELGEMLEDCDRVPEAMDPMPQATAGIPVRTYKNCAELRKDYPGGISREAHPKVYEANTSRDRDGDGRACE